MDYVLLGSTVFSITAWKEALHLSLALAWIVLI